MKIGGRTRTDDAVNFVHAHGDKGVRNVDNLVSIGTRVESLITTIARARPAGTRPYSNWAGDSS
ncbi:hypothetical protein [Aromatoleum tolulyticum]|uniref:hypothetical protein n=1 Tax=Aromatoleum tolulyticum TaxID=34027 RepID=UPI001115513A|nr:hypothetical protein [Aromatoleum tolulyticum]